MEIGTINLSVSIYSCFFLFFHLCANYFLRLSNSTTIQHPLKQPFVLKLDTETFQMAPPQEEYKQAIGNLEVEELTNKVYFQKIKERILSQKRHFILYSYVTIFSFIAA